MASVAGVALTNPGRVLWDGQGVTKLDLARFYADVADRILPHVTARPLTMVRCPSGDRKDCFFQKRPWAGLHESVRRAPVGSGPAEALVIDDLTGLIALVQAGVLEIHPWGARIEAIETPDRMIFDLDPGEGVGFAAVTGAAKEVRDRLSALALQSFVKTSGGKGLHVVVPLAPQAGWNAVKGFARRLAEAMAADNPQLYVATAAKAERKGRIFVDYLRNARGATAVAAYSTRARPGAPVSTPLEWDELSPDLSPGRYTLGTVPMRAADPWHGLDRLRQRLRAPED